MVLDGRGTIQTINHALADILAGVREFIGRRPLKEREYGHIRGD
jgi:hypothetical protein